VSEALSSAPSHDPCFAFLILIICIIGALAASLLSSSASIFSHLNFLSMPLASRLHIHRLQDGRFGPYGKWAHVALEFF
jgi:hypothetical protein